MVMDRYELTMEPSAEEVIVYLPFYTRTGVVVFHVILGLGSVVPPFFVMDMLGYCVRTL